MNNFEDQLDRIECYMEIAHRKRDVSEWERLHRQRDGLAYKFFGMSYVEYRKVKAATGVEIVQRQC